MERVLNFIYNINNRIKMELENLNDEISFCAMDLNDNVIEYKSNQNFETGSAIKSFIVLEYYNQILQKKINRNDILKFEKKDETMGAGILKDLEPGIELTSKNLLILMIILSDNIATNLIIEYLGLDSINETIKRYGFDNTEMFNKIDLKTYNKVGVTTAYEYAKLFKGYLTNEFFSEEISREIIEIFKMQKYNSVLTKFIPKQYFNKNVECKVIKYIASKSGKMSGKIFDIPTDTIINDGGIISTINGDYVIAIFAKENYDKNRIKEFDVANVCSRISALILDYFLMKKNLHE